jgi:antitoxin ParD1/3/4
LLHKSHIQKLGFSRESVVVQSAMPITLTPSQEAWLRSHVAAGDFSSIEEAARQLIDERIAERELEGGDLAWAKPLVDEGIAAFERGEFMTLEEQRARNRVRLAALKR